MDNKEKESFFREQYNVMLYSAPVDKDNPAFDSLLSAMKGVYYGNYEIDLLVTYYKSLSEQLEKSIQAIKKMDEETPEEYKEVVKTQHNISLGAIHIVQNTLDLLRIYIEKPTKENLATCVQAVLDSKFIMRDVHDMLDENIKKAQSDQPSVEEVQPSQSTEEPPQQTETDEDFSF